MNTYDPTDLTGQADAKAEREALVQTERDSQADDFKWFMSSKRGRRVVHGLLLDSRFNESPFNANAMTMAFNSGLQITGIRLFALINKLCPETYALMLKENTKDKAK